MQLRDYQQQAVQSIFDYYYAGSKGNPCVAMPTGTGKSLILAEFCKRVLQNWPDQRIMLATHVKELVQQDYNALKLLWPQAPIGIYSAGLKQKNTSFPVTFGGVASMVKNIEAFGHVDILLVDEAHLIAPSEGTNYQKLIEGLKKTNANLKVVGLTATPFRLGQGMITDGGIVTDICCDMTGVRWFNWFIENGYLAPLIPRRTSVELDVSSVGISSTGDFNSNELQLACDRDEITYAALQEACVLGQDRKCWLVFATGVEHCEHIAEMLNRFGVPTTFVHSKIEAKERDARILDFKSGKYRALVNVSVLTTGFDCPQVDQIVMLRPTASPVLHIQTLGRGTRIHPAKTNCQVLDFARNTARLGPINDPVIPRKRGEKGGPPPVKICEACGVYNHASARECGFCGEPFIFQTKLVASAGTDELIRSDLPVEEWFDVDHVTYKKHKKITKPLPTLQVNYHCGMRRFAEYIAFEHDGFARKRAKDWWMQRHAADVPATVDDALAASGELRHPRRLKVWVNRPQGAEIRKVEW